MTNKEYNNLLKLRERVKRDFSLYKETLNKLDNAIIKLIASTLESMLTETIDLVCGPGGISGTHVASLVLKKMAAEHSLKSIEAEIKAHELNHGIDKSNVTNN